jgi:hypothetical protein
MNNMIQLANIPHAALPPEKTTYNTANQWYKTLAEMHLAQLTFQHNDIVSSRNDCRNKYIASQLFCSLAKKGRLSTFGFAEDDWSAQSSTMHTLLPAPSGSGAFRIWCDDFRPANLLLNKDDDIVGVIDWEFTYAGPIQFVLDPPWWLLLEVPEMWSSGIEDWRAKYEMRLGTWLASTKWAESVADSGSSSLASSLSTYMHASWNTGRFWLNYAARKSWAFDAIFWKYLDERFFGHREEGVQEEDLWKTRVHLLGEREKIAMEAFVERKMEESSKRILVNWQPSDSKAQLPEILFE